jgi:hypothetical protein
MHQSCIEINTISKWIETRFHLTLGTIGYGQNQLHACGTFDENRAPIWRQDQHRLHANQSDLRLDPRHLLIPLSAPKTISKPIAHSTQIVHLSFVEVRTISKATEMSFHLTHITYEFHHFPKMIFWAYGMLVPICAPLLRQD